MALITPQEAAIELLRREEAREHLAGYVEYESGIVLEEWQYIMCDRLELLPRQKGVRLLLHKPPQYGGSFVVSQRLPSWLIGDDPTTRLRLCCYNETHATKFSKVNRAIMHSPEYRNIFPGVRIDPSENRESEWSTPERKAFNDSQASFVALGLRSGFVGQGGDHVIIDDPYKDRLEAFSHVINDGIWGWWNETVLPRLNPDSNVVVMFHRWKEDDLAGRLMAQGGWEVMRFPAIADGLPDDCSQLPVGTALSPRYPLDYLAQVEKAQGEAAFSSLYQGLPKPRSGAMYKAEWFRDELWVREEPLGDDVTRVLYWDLGGSDRRDACYTCGVLAARPQSGETFIVDMEDGQWSPAERNQRMVQFARRCREKYGFAGMPKIYFEQPFGMGAKEASKAIVMAHDGIAIKADPPVGDKVMRSEPFNAQCEVGNVRFVRGAWKQRFIDQFTVFPNGKLKDIVDATSGAYNKLAATPRKLTTQERHNLAGAR